MANRWMANRIYAHEKDIKIVTAKVAIGATGAPTLDTANSKGVASISRVSAGKYTFTFGITGAVDKYVKLLGWNIVFDTSGAADAVPASPIAYITDDSIASAGTLEVTFADLETPAATDPANGEVMKAMFFFGDSTAP